MTRKILKIVALIAVVGSVSGCAVYPAGYGYRGGGYHAPRYAYGGGWGHGYGRGYGGGGYYGGGYGRGWR